MLKKVLQQVFFLW